MKKITINKIIKASYKRDDDKKAKWAYVVTGGDPAYNRFNHVIGTEKDGLKLLKETMKYQAKRNKSYELGFGNRDDHSNSLQLTREDPTYRKIVYLNDFTKYEACDSKDPWTIHRNAKRKLKKEEQELIQKTKTELTPGTKIKLIKGKKHTKHYKNWGIDPNKEYTVIHVDSEEHGFISAEGLPIRMFPSECKKA